MSASEVATRVGDADAPLDVDDHDETEPDSYLKRCCDAINSVNVLTEMSGRASVGQRRRQHRARNPNRGNNHNILSPNQSPPPQRQGGWEPQRIMHKQQYNWYRHLETPGQMADNISDRLLDDEGDDMDVGQAVFRRPTMDTVVQDYFVSAECLAQLKAQVE